MTSNALTSPSFNSIEIHTFDASGTPVHAVNARDLHASLHVGKDFSNWIKDHISKFGFAENVDFVVETCSPNLACKSEEGFLPNLASKHGGHNRVDYYLTLDMAKELAMVQRNDLGRAVRKFFIEAEKKLRAQAPAVPQSLPEALRLAADLAEQLAIAGPKAQTLDHMVASPGSILPTVACKDLGIRPGEAFSFFNGLGWVFRRTGNPDWIAYQPVVDAGWLEHRMERVELRSGASIAKCRVYVTPAGMAELTRRLRVN